MKTILEIIVKNLVEYPNDILIKETQENDLTILELSVNPKDMGKIIGKQGKIANSIRAVVKAAASYQNKKVIVKIN